MHEHTRCANVRAREGAFGPPCTVGDLMDIGTLFESSRSIIIATCLQVSFDTNKVIGDTFGAAGYPVAEARLYLRHRAA